MQTIVPIKNHNSFQGPFNASKAVEFQRQMTVCSTKVYQCSSRSRGSRIFDSAGDDGLVYGLRLAQAQERQFSLC